MSEGRPSPGGSGLSGLESAELLLEVADALGGRVVVAALAGFEFFQRFLLLPGLVLGALAGGVGDAGLVHLGGHLAVGLVLELLQLIDGPLLGEALLLAGALLSGEVLDLVAGGGVEADGAVVAHGEVQPQRRQKRPALRAKQGMWTLFGEAGQVLKRGHELAGVLSVLERKLLKIVED